MPYHVPTSATPILCDPPFVFGLLLLGTAIGYRLLRLLRLPLETVSALERGLISAALGMGLLQFLPFLLGMTGSLTPKALAVGLTGAGIVFLPDMARVLRGIARAMLRLRSAPPPRWIVCGLLIVAVLMSATALQALSIATIGDDGYHLTAPKRWLQAGALIYLPSFTHTQAPMGVEMLYTITLGLCSDTAPGLLHCAFAILSIASVYALGRRLRNEALGFTAIACWLAMCPIYLSYLAYVDMGIAFEILSAVSAWVLWRRTKASGWLVASALCAGFAASFKLTGIFAGAILGLLTVAERRREGMSLKRAVGVGVAFVGVALLPVLPWFYRTWRLTGNPVYPMFWTIFPTRDWCATVAHGFDLYFKYYLFGTVRNWSLATREAIRLAAMGFIVVAGALLWRRRGAESRALLVFVCLSGLIGVYFTGVYPRFHWALIAIAWLVLFLPYAHILAHSRCAHAALLLLVAYKTLTHLYATHDKLLLASQLATGCLSRDAYFKSQPDNRYWLWQVVNTQTPPDARILSAALYPCSGESGGGSFYSDRFCYVTDAHLQCAIHMDSWPRFLADVRRFRIGYLFVMDSAMTRYAPMHYAPSDNEFPFARRLAKKYGHRIAVRGHYELYRLDGLTTR